MRKDPIGRDLGIVTIEPDSPCVIVGRRCFFKVSYKVGARAVETGGAIRFKLPGLIVYEGGPDPVTCSNASVKWTCSNRIPAFNGKNGREFTTLNYLFVEVREGRLNPGDLVTVTYGGSAILGATAAPQWAQKWPVEVAVDCDGARLALGSGFYLVDGAPVLSVVNDRPFRMEVFVPSYTSAGQSFRTVVRMLDRYNNIVEDYMGSVVLEARMGNQRALLGEYAFKPADKGVGVFAGTCMQNPGIHRIVARDEVLGLCARSNPTKTQPKGVKSLSVFWGDTHCHSSISADEAAINPLNRRPAEVYDYARRRAALDFCMVTDHIEDQSEADWAETCRAAKAACESGLFVTFSGFEATYQPLRGEGDKNVYFLTDDESWVNRGTTQELYDKLKQREAGAMVIPHLHNRTNWKRHDPALERVVEIYSHWGCGLSQASDPPIIPGAPRPPESYVHQALEDGAKLGFIASADHSNGHPGDDFWWSLSNYNGGLAAVYSPALDRQGIWDGLWKRRCYATTRARILLEFEVAGHPMGEEFTMEDEKRVLNIKVYGTSAIEVIEIVKNGQIVQRFPGERRLDMEITYADSSAERDTDYYYVHVLQQDAEQAWSSPVWVRAARLQKSMQQ